MHYFYKLSSTDGLQYLFNSQSVWLIDWDGLRSSTGGSPALESLLIYTASWSPGPGHTDQYLAIPSAFTSVFVNLFTVAYTLIALITLRPFDGPHLFPPWLGPADARAIYALCLGLVWVTWRENLLDFMKKCRDEINVQLGRKE